MRIHSFAFVTLLAAGCGGVTAPRSQSTETGKADSAGAASGPLHVTVGEKICIDGPDNVTFVFNAARTSVAFGSARASVDANGRFALDANWRSSTGVWRGHLVGRTLSVTVTDSNDSQEQCTYSSGIGVRADGSVDKAIVAAVDAAGGVKQTGEPLDVQVGAEAHRWNDAEVQDLQGGGDRIVIHADGSAQAFLVEGPLFDAFYAAGGPGVLGWPVENVRSVDNSKFQRFAKGYVIGDGKNAGGYVGVVGDLGQPGLLVTGWSDGALAACYTRNGGGSVVGSAIDAGGSVLGHSWNDSWVQDFDGGSDGRGICMHGVDAYGNFATNDAYYVYGDFWGAYWDDGHGALGYPTSDRQPWRGHELQTFEHGYIAWDDASGAYKGFSGTPPTVAAVGDDGSGNTDSAIVACHAAPTIGMGDPIDAGHGANVFRWGAATAQSFMLGTAPATAHTAWCIHPDGDANAHAVYGGLGDYYINQGGPSSSLGAPIDDVFYTSGDIYPPFKADPYGQMPYLALENNTIYWDASTGYYTN